MYLIDPSSCSGQRCIRKANKSVINGERWWIKECKRWWQYHYSREQVLYGNEEWTKSLVDGWSLATVWSESCASLDSWMLWSLTASWSGDPGREFVNSFSKSIVCLVPWNTRWWNIERSPLCSLHQRKICVYSDGRSGSKSIPMWSLRLHDSGWVKSFLSSPLFYSFQWSDILFFSWSNSFLICKKEKREKRKRKRKKIQEPRSCAHQKDGWCWGRKEKGC